MTTSGVTTSCTDCNVDDQDVVIATPTTNNDDQAAAGEQTDLVSELPVDMDDVDQPTVALPPDGGWGWAVVAASFIANLILDGVCYTFGIIMPELLQLFQAGKEKTCLLYTSPSPRD